MTEGFLIPIEEIKPSELMSEEGIDSLLGKIKEWAEERKLEADITTAKGRDEIKSNAYKITLSKGVLDRTLDSEAKEARARVAMINGARGKAKSFCDELAKEVRQPLTDFEEDQKRQLEEKRQLEALIAAWDEAHSMNELIDRESELARREAELAAKEEERLAEERKAQEASESDQRKKDQEAEIARKAEQAAEAAIAAEKQRAEEAERRVEQAAEDARVAAEVAEKNRLAAIEQERQKNLREEAERLAAKESQQKKADAEAQRLRENAEHRKAINNKALAALVEKGVQESDAKAFIGYVYRGEIPGMKMDY